MTENQMTAIRCALADLCGSLQVFNQNDIYSHDWEAHRQSILELAEVFGLEDEVPEELK
jgi:hypothetical protein